MKKFSSPTKNVQAASISFGDSLSSSSGRVTSFNAVKSKRNGAIDPLELAQELESKMDEIKLNENEMESLVLYWKSFKLDDLDGQEATNLRLSKAKVPNIEASELWQTRQQSLENVRSAIEKMKKSGVDRRAISWGTFSLVEDFKDWENAENALRTYANRYYAILYSGWFPSVHPDTYKVLDLYRDIWACTFKAIKCFKTAGLLKLAEAGSRTINKRNGTEAKIISSHHHWNQNAEKYDSISTDFGYENSDLGEVIKINEKDYEKFMKSKDQASLYKLGWVYLNAAATPDVRMLTQSPDVRILGSINPDIEDARKENGQKILSSTAGFMKAIVQEFNRQAKIPKKVDISPESEFSQMYYEAKSFFSATIEV